MSFFVVTGFIQVEKFKAVSILLYTDTC